jgi:hypothetical protein
MGLLGVLLGVAAAPSDAGAPAGDRWLTAQRIGHAGALRHFEIPSQSGLRAQ